MQVKYWGVATPDAYGKGVTVCDTMYQRAKVKFGANISPQSIQEYEYVRGNIGNNRF